MRTTDIGFLLDIGELLLFANLETIITNPTMHDPSERILEPKP